MALKGRQVVDFDDLESRAEQKPRQNKAEQEPRQPWKPTRRQFGIIVGGLALGAVAAAVGIKNPELVARLLMGDQISGQSSFYRVFLQSHLQAGYNLDLGAEVIVPEQADVPKGVEIAGTRYTEHTKAANEYRYSGAPIDLHVKPKPMIYTFRGASIKPGEDGIFRSQTLTVFDGYGKIAEFKTEPLKQTPAKHDSFTNYGWGIEQLLLLPANDPFSNPSDAPEGVYAIVTFHGSDLDWDSNRPDRIPFALKSNGRTIKQGKTPAQQNDVFLGKLDKNTPYEFVLNEGKLPEAKFWFTPRNLFQYDYSQK